MPTTRLYSPASFAVVDVDTAELATWKARGYRTEAEILTIPLPGGGTTGPQASGSLPASRDTLDEVSALAAAGGIPAVTDAAVAGIVSSGAQTQAALNGGWSPVMTTAATATSAATLVGDKHTPVDATSGPLTMTLPTPARVGQQVRVEKVDSSANAVTVSGTLRGTASTIAMPFQYEVLTFVAESLSSWRVASGNKTKAALDATYQQRKALVYADFSALPDGAGPTAADSGQPWAYTTNSYGADAKLRMVGGYLTNVATGASPAAAGHVMVNVGSTVRRIGAEIAFDAGSGGLTGSAALVIWSQPLVYPGPVVDTSVHVSFGASTWSAVTFSGGTSATIATGGYSTPLAAGTRYIVEVISSGTSLTLLLPDGSTTTITDARLGAAERLVPSWETYQGNAATDDRFKFRRVWADAAALEDPARATATTAQALIYAQRAAQAATPKAASYPQAAAGNVTVAMPASSAEISTDLRIAFVAPPSGKVLVTAMGHVNCTAAGDVIWTLLLPEGSISLPRTVVRAVSDEVHTAQWLVTGLAPGSRYTTQWQHRATNSAAGTLRLNKTGGQEVVFSVVPVAT